MKIIWTDGASDDWLDACTRCSQLRPNWPEEIAALAGLDPATRGTVTTLNDGTMPLGGDSRCFLVNSYRVYFTVLSLGIFAIAI